MACGYRERKFAGHDVTDAVGNFIFCTKRHSSTLIAHHAAGFDSFFILSYLLKNGRKPDTVIYQGSHMTYMHVKQGLNIRMVDSLKFLPMKLAKLPAAFGLPTSKGEFPHMFNTRENFYYKGPYPHAKYYGAEYMSPSERAKLAEWLQEKVDSGAQFDMQEQIEHYCRLDVHILAKACLRYRQLLMDATSSNVQGIDRPGIDPFNQVTAAGVSHAIYRAKMIPEEWRVLIKEEDPSEGGNESEKWVNGRAQDGVLLVEINPGEWIREDRVQVLRKKFISTPIAQIPLGGYAPRENYSKISITWLKWMEHLKRTQGNDPLHNIRHACSVNGEERIARPRGGPGREHTIKWTDFLKKTRPFTNSMAVDIMVIIV